MNEMMNGILTRRSIRKYTDQPIPDNILEDIVEAALHAPSGRGEKTWKFTVVTNRDKIQQLAAAVSEELGRTGYNMYNPTVLIIPSNLRDSRFGKEDDAVALENIFLAAHSYGIGSCWINQLQGICDTERIRKVLDEFGIPENHVVYGMAALGYI
ncbi:MAG: nitroreductase family protein [Eubacterium sp.]|nr:nitroreductase family protein [Eubacterium sp.]